jgi:hypothetical protein
MELQIYPDTAVGVAIRRTYPVITAMFEGKAIFATDQAMNGMMRLDPSKKRKMGLGFFRTLKKSEELIPNAPQNVRKANR